MLKQLKTNRKFYNKWAYKLSLTIPGITILRIYNSYDLVEKILNDPYEHQGIYSIDKAVSNKHDIKELLSFLNSVEGNYCKRIERDTVDIYTNDKQIHYTLFDKFKTRVKLSCVPRDNLIDQLNSNKYIICKKLPFDKYKFKAYLLPHRIRNDRNEKIKYIEWLSKQPRIKITDKVIEWFIVNDYNWDRRYIYVEDEKTLFMIQLRNSSVLGRVYEYLPSDKY